jgi:lysophospholipase L1-like esterase
MATLRTYGATVESFSALMHLRLGETSGATASDSAGDLDGRYEGGVARGADGPIGNGAIHLDGSTGYAVIEPLTGTITVSALGDSLIDGSAFQAPGQRFTPVLDAALHARGLDASVLDHATGGQRSGDALNPRTASQFTVAEALAGNPDVVILELGTNDAINRIAPNTVESNLREIIEQLQAGGAEVLLTGAFGFYPDRRNGAGYATEAERDAFEQIFPDLAAETGATLLSDGDGSFQFLGGFREGARITGGVLGDPALQALDDLDGDGDVELDGLHPNAAGVEHIVPRIVPQLIELGAQSGAIQDRLQLSSGSFEIWFTAASLGLRQSLLEKNASMDAPGMFAVQLRADGSLAAMLSAQDDVAEVASRAGAVQAGVPTHLVLTFGAGGMHLLINGVEVDSDPFTGGLDLGSNFEPLVLGASSGFSTPGGALDDLRRFFDGTIDELVAYDRALSQLQVQQLYRAGQQGLQLAGTRTDDSLIGSIDPETLRGGAGDDTLQGRGGDDVLGGDAGDDVLAAGAGNDQLFGRLGADTLFGGAGIDRLQGNPGPDRLTGGPGRDQLSGDLGPDDLRGGPGNDLLVGGFGFDTLVGGGGSDTFRLELVTQGIDRILDFRAGPGGDVLDLRDVLDFGPGDAPASFVRLSTGSANTQVAVSPTGAGTDFSPVFNLVGVTGLEVGNLVNDGNVQLA